MPRKMSTFSARKLLLVVAVLIASWALVSAQSGRRGATKPTAPVTPPVAVEPQVPSIPQESARLHFLVAVDESTGFERVPFHVPTTVLEVCVRRLAEPKEVAATAASQRMTRADAVKAAKSEMTRYVVWLHVGNERDDYGADVSANSNQLYVTFTIFEPVTAKVKETGRVYYGTARAGNVGVGVPIPGAVLSDFAIKETARQTADRILEAFKIRGGGLPR